MCTFLQPMSGMYVLSYWTMETLRQLKSSKQNLKTTKCMYISLQIVSCSPWIPNLRQVRRSYVQLCHYLSYSFVIDFSLLFGFKKFDYNSLVIWFTCNAVCDPYQWILANVKILSNVFQITVCKELINHNKLHFYLMFNSNSRFPNFSVTNVFTLNRF